MTSITSINDNHLGGCIKEGDPDTYSPELWNYIIKKYNVKTMVDIGCGLGYSTLYFNDKGVDVLGVDGLQFAQEHFKVEDKFRLNDYQNGSALKESESFDLCWCCEFVEHVFEKYSDNFLQDFTKSKYLAVTHAVPGQVGYHHVNCQPEYYWVDRIEKLGFDLDREETNKMRSMTTAGNYFGKTGLFFINTSL